MNADPFALEPQLWFGLLCEGLSADQRGRLNFQSVFNQVALLDPPGDTGVPSNAFLNAFLVVGFTGGLGHFEAAIQLRDADERVLWERPEGSWVFDVGPGNATAVLVQQVQYWLTQPGHYHFLVRLSPTNVEQMIPFEVARQIGPAEVTSETQGNE